MPRVRTSGAEKLAAAAPVFAALSDETRLRIVARLSREGPASIIGLTGGEKISRQAITKHLRALENADLARSYRSGRERIWALRTSRLTEVRRHLEQISHQWDAVIDRLRAFVEKDE